MKKWLAGAALLASLQGGAAAAPFRPTASGPVAGLEENGVQSFRGIPYAAPPVGDLRWAPPASPASWTAPRGATAFGANCLQNPLSDDMAPPRGAYSEDCLTLNVWTPAAAERPLPVVLWIHGGGFVIGGTSPARYDGTNFARDGVVFVSVNYRLGRFGWFAHPDLTGGSGNFALMDMIAALDWIRANIAAFGGDPARITIMGESAGGMAVNMLMTSPAAKGKFAGAIAESGGDSGLAPFVAAIQAGAALGARLGAKDLNALRALPAAAILGNLGLGSPPDGTYMGPMLDGTLMPEQPAAAFKAGHAANVPYLAGANSRELGFYAKDFFTSPAADLAWTDRLAKAGDKADAVRAAYDVARIGPGEAVVQIDSDAAFAEPARFFARAHPKGWLYRFSYVATKDRADLPGALHATEIPYAFDSIDWGASAADKAAAKTTHAIWVNFIKTGKAGWPAYTGNDAPLMDFGPEGPAVIAPDPRKARLDLIEAFKNR